MPIIFKLMVGMYVLTVITYILNSFINSRFSRWLWDTSLITLFGGLIYVFYEFAAATVLHVNQLYMFVLR